MAHCLHELARASMAIGEAALALHFPALGPADQFREEFVLIAHRQIDLLLGLFPDDTKTFFDFEAVTNALRDRAAKAFTENLLLVGESVEIQRRGKWAR